MPREPKRDDFIVGATATKAPTGIQQWVGWLWDGRRHIQFTPRNERQRALDDARAHMDRLLTPELPDKIWRPDA